MYDETARGGKMKGLNMNLNRVEDIDLYIVGACICSSVGGVSQCITLLIFGIICWFRKEYEKICKRNGVKK